MLGFYNYTTWLTYAGMALGVSGIWCAINGYITTAMILLSLCGLTDTFDGIVARTKKDRTEQMMKFGIQIDSLSDLVCFGVLPSVILCALAAKALPNVPSLVFLPLGFAFSICALIRLAFFNVAEEMRQKNEGGTRKFYNGIPVTMVSIFIPTIYGLSELLRFLLKSVVPSDVWSIVFFVVYCILLCFFGFGFLFQRFKVAKLKGKKLAVVIGLGSVGVVGMIIAYIFNN